MKKVYYKYLDIIRIVSCIGVLLYHLNILKGGYLAVCTFFVMSGYLAVISAFKVKNFSLKEYYLKRIKKIYIPLLIVVFVTVTAVTILSNFNWINLKPEVTSIIFGYNNYWQLNANLDYFVRNATTPFMHFWYIAILLQFELVFPIIYIILRFLGKKISKTIPCIILIIIGILSSILFYDMITTNHIMQAYYGTFTRLFSLAFGMLIGFIHTYYKPIINKKNNVVIFNIYLILLIVSFFVVDFNGIGMFIATFISMRLISYAISIKSKKKSSLSFIAQTSYEIYLVQYPVIFLMNNYHMNSILKIIIIIVITIIISIIIHLALNSKNKNLKTILLVPLIAISIFGLYTYVIAKDYTDDMIKLKRDLNENQKLIEKKQKELLLKQKEEDEKWQEYLDNSEKEEQDLEQSVRNLRIIGIGDSIMELAVKELYEEFPNGYFDAATNRTEKASFEVISDLKAKGIDSDVYLLNIGTNGYCDEACKEELLKTIGEDKYVFWVNATSPDYESFNPTLESFASKHDNVFIIDWRSYGLAHQEYLIYDKVHPNVRGLSVYAHKIYEGVYNQYLNIMKDLRAKKIKEHEEYEKNKITFIGNDLLKGIYDQVNNNYQNKTILIDDYNYNKIKDILSDQSTSNNIVLVFNNNSKLSNREYQKLIDLYKDKSITIVTTDTKLKVKGANIIKYDSTNKTDLDDIHLTKKGNKELFNTIKKNIK